MSRRLAVRISWLAAGLLWLGFAFGVQADAAVKVQTPPLEMKPEFYDVQPVPFDS
ncbi:hypothetical protein [Desmospora profundinema]|uniref:Uncharacterized protein n=1 Tax=Desmospora profundinema TaxID=1571184 RepID=A0ABU1IQG4_9BACL|nr:hypothetical protein [Desmospora profundinema]MDR6227029.1 hypothetical protein [Desmospora profundinema]